MQPDTRMGQNTASDNDRGQFEDGAEGIYSSSDQDYDSRDEKI